MRSFWKAKILEMAETDIFCVKLNDDHDSAYGASLRSVFIEL